MSKSQTAYLIPHCDYEHCDLGIIEFKCPNCKKNITDYDIWWKKDVIYDGEKVNFLCNNKDCNSNLVIYYNKKNFEYKVSFLKINI